MPRQDWTRQDVLYEVCVGLGQTELNGKRINYSHIVLSADDNGVECLQVRADGGVLNGIKGHLYVCGVDATNAILPLDVRSDVDSPCLVVRGDGPARGLDCTICQLREHCPEDGIVPLGEAAVQLGVDRGVIIGIGEVGDVPLVGGRPCLGESNRRVRHSGSQGQLVDWGPVGWKVVCSKDLSAIRHDIRIPCHGLVCVQNRYRRLFVVCQYLPLFQQIDPCGIVQGRVYLGSKLVVESVIPEFIV